MLTVALALGRLEYGSTDLAIVNDIDHLSIAITHATAPAFMLGAVAGFLSILIGRLDVVAGGLRALRAPNATNRDPSGAVAATLKRRMELLSRAVYFGVLSALVTAALLIGAFMAALLDMGHGRIVAIMFAAALALLMASLVELARDMRVYMVHLHIE
jgi:hypothetical protein